MTFDAQMLFKFVSAASAMYEKPVRMHTFTIEKLKNRSRKKCLNCYRLLRRDMNSREASKRVKKVLSYCKDCDGQPAYCLSCFNSVHVEASFANRVNYQE